MATDKETGINVNNNKENSEKDEFVGIEANDLATLLNRFEEATSSDDLSVPRAIHKTKWNIMKAKSAGNSPAVTPPTTPPPTLNERVGPIRLKTFTQAPPIFLRNQSTPIRLTVVHPVTSVKSTLSSSPSLSTSFTNISTTSSVSSQPKVHIQIPKPSLPSSSAQGVSSIPAVISHNGKSIYPAIQNRVIKIPFPTNVSKNKNSDQTFSSASGSTANTRTFNVLRMPALDAASPYSFLPSSTKQIIPKKRSSMLPNAVEVGKRRKLEGSSSVVTSLTSNLSESMQINKSTPLLKSKLISAPSPSQQQLSPSSFGSIPTSSSSAPTISGGPITADSCVSGNLTNKHAQNEKSKNSKLQLEAKLQRDEHAYCWSGPCFNNKTSQRIGLSTPSEDLSSQTPDLTCSNLFGIESSDSNPQEGEVVLEEGEIYVDTNGNDIFSKETSGGQVSDSKQRFRYVCDAGASTDGESSNRVVCFDTDGDTINRRGRKYRRPVELRTSPVREDKNDFFDKIPSHYTALSIPAKQIKKSVFESVSGTLGSQDHLAMPAEFEVQEDEEQGEYNKVPVHHRIFTNTSHEVQLHPVDRPSCSLAEVDKPQQGRSSRTRRMSSASRHSGHSTSSHRSNRSGSRYSYGDRSSRSRSRSPAYSDHSSVDNRKSRPVTRRRRNSSSQLSVSSCSSSCSSNSYCSTCGASLSRSRSRSYSSDRSRERSYSPRSRYSRSRSRSRSPREKDRRQRRRSSRSSTPEKTRSRWRSDSRSQSPVRRRRNSFRTSSRSRRHQLKERSSAERKIMEVRKQKEDEKVRAMEERRVLYVGKLPENYTKHELRKRFESFGEIKGVRLNFRVHGDNYGFVTFAYACDAFAAKEKGNTISGQTKFDLCYGGRRRFCPDKYADLDGNREIEEEYAPMPNKASEELDYAALLKQHVRDRGRVCTDAK